MNAKDLTKEPPRSPRMRIRDYVILARAIDKCRAELTCQMGDYHYDCPLDKLLFGFKGITAADLRHEVARGVGDDAIGIWIDQQGARKTPREIVAWSRGLELYSLYYNPPKRAYFIAECKRLGLDPKKTTMFDWLEADDRSSFEPVRAT